MNPTAQILTDARALIETPGSWCQGSFARDDTGRPYPGKRWERSWCMAGAIYKVDPENGQHAEVAIMTALNIPNIRLFNDHPATTHAMVLDAFTAAIGKAQTDG